MLRWLLQQRLGTSTWLYQLRWFAVIGQLITICGASVLTDFQLPFWLLLLLVAFTAGTNVAYGIWLRTDNAPRDKTDATSATDADTPSLESPLSVRHQFTATLLMLLDLGMLTAMLYLSGGVHNPFAFFYFVNLAVAGVTLRPRFAWLLAVLAVFGYLLLLRFYLPVAQLQTRTPSSENTLRLLGLFFAFATCSTVVTYFVTRISEQLSLQQRRLRDVERERSRARRLEGLTTLAAGAAHELATPLSTIDVITRELTHHLDEAEVSDTVRRDVQLIDQQLEICRQILVRLRGAAGDYSAAGWDRTTVGELIDATLEGIRDPHRVEVTDGPSDVEEHPIWIPQEAVAQALRNLVHNGLDASGNGRVRLETRIIDAAETSPAEDPSTDLREENAEGILPPFSGDVVQFVIIDQGEGISHDAMGRLGEPFFTTKEPGRGMGLGLFLTRNVVSRLGGRLDFESNPGEGTVARVSLPVHLGPPNA